MSLVGAKFIRLDENGVPLAEGTVLAKGRKFAVGYYASCDYVLEDARVKSVHCEIQCDAFGRVTIHNLCQEHPISVNGEAVGIKRLLLNGARISILDQTFLWEFPKTTSSEAEDLPRDTEAATTPLKQVVAGSPEQAPNSCPDLRVHREVAKRLTVHNFAYCIQSDEEGNTTIESPETSYNEDFPQKIEEGIKSGSTDTETSTTLKRPEERRSITPEPQTVPSSLLQLEVTPKMNLINCTQNKNNASTEKKRKSLTLCQQSDVVITSFSPRETGVRIEKSFTAILKPATTPKSVYSTPKSVLSNVNDDGDSNDFIDFSTPATSKKHLSRLATKNSSMHLIDFTTPSKLRPASPYLKSAIKNSAKRLGSQKQTNFPIVLEEDEQLGVTALPSTPIATPTNDSFGKETPVSVISVNSTDTSSVIEISGDDDTPGASTSHQMIVTPSKPQSLIKRVLLTSAKKQATTSPATTPRRTAAISGTTPTQCVKKTKIGSPITPTSVTNRAALLARRQSLSTSARKSLAGSKLKPDNSPSSSLGGPSTSHAAAAAAARRSSLNPLAGRKLLSSTPLGATNLQRRNMLKTSPLHKVRKSVSGTPLGSHISKTRKSIALPSNRSTLSKTTTCSPALAKRTNTSATPSNTRSQISKTTTPRNIPKVAQSSERKQVDDKQHIVESVNLSSTFTIDSDDEATSSVDKETKPKDTTFSPVKDTVETKVNKTFSPVKNTTETKVELNMTFSPVKQILKVETIESPLDVAEVKPITQVEISEIPRSSTPNTVSGLDVAEVQLNVSNATTTPTDVEDCEEVSKIIATPCHRQIPTIVINSPDVITESFAEIIDDSFEKVAKENDIQVPNTEEIDNVSEDILDSSELQIIEDTSVKIKEHDYKKSSEENGDRNEKHSQIVEESEREFSKHVVKTAENNSQQTERVAVDLEKNSHAIEDVSIKSECKATEVNSSESEIKEAENVSVYLAECKVPSQDIVDCSIIIEDQNNLEKLEVANKVTEDHDVFDINNEGIKDKTNEGRNEIIENIQTNNEKTNAEVESEALLEVIEEPCVIIDKDNSHIPNDEPIEGSNKTSEFIEVSIEEHKTKLAISESDDDETEGLKEVEETDKIKESNVVQIKNIAESNETGDSIANDKLKKTNYKLETDDQNDNAAVDIAKSNDTHQVKDGDAFKINDDSIVTKENETIFKEIGNTASSSSDFDEPLAIKNSADNIQINQTETDGSISKRVIIGESEEITALLEEIDDVLNKSDEIQQKRLDRNDECVNENTNQNLGIENVNTEKLSMEVLNDINEKEAKIVKLHTRDEKATECNSDIGQTEEIASPKLEAKNEKVEITNTDSNIPEKPIEAEIVMVKHVITKPALESNQTSSIKKALSEKEKHEVVKEAISGPTNITPKTPNLRGIREMLQIPKQTTEPKTPRFDGLRNLLRTPNKASKYNETEDLSEVQSLLQTPPVDDSESLTSKSRVKQVKPTFTPRRSARRASTSVEITSANTNTPKRLNTRRASMSTEVTTSLPLTPRRIVTRRLSIDMDASINSPQIQSAGANRVTIFEEQVEDMGAIVEEESISDECDKLAIETNTDDIQTTEDDVTTSKNVDTKCILMEFENKADSGGNTNVIVENICEVIQITEDGKDISILQEGKQTEQIKLTPKKESKNAQMFVVQEELAQSKDKIEEIADDSLCEIIEDSYEATSSSAKEPTLVKKDESVIEIIETEKLTTAGNGESVVEILDEFVDSTLKEKEESIAEILDESEYDYGNVIADNKATESVKSEMTAKLEPTTPKSTKLLKRDASTPKTPIMVGMRELLKTPGSALKTPKFFGLRDLVRTPHGVCSTPLLAGVKELMDTPTVEAHMSRAALTFTEFENDEVNDANNTDLNKTEDTCPDKFFTTPRAKNIMIPTIPASAVIEKSSDSVELVHSTEYDLNDTNAGTANLEDIFKTPVATRFSERITDSINEDSAADDEILDIAATTSSKVATSAAKELNEKQNLSAEEAFDEMIGQSSAIHTPARKVYARKSLSTPMQQSPFSAVEVISDLPKTDIQEWVDSLEDAEIPNEEDEEFNESLKVTANDEQEVTMNPDLVEDYERELSCDPLDGSSLEKNSSSTRVTDSCTKVLISANDANTTTASEIMVNVSTVSSLPDPLCNSALKTICNSVSKVQDLSVVEENSSETPITSIESDISGINLLDQTEDSVFSEALIVSDTEPSDKTIEESFGNIDQSITSNRKKSDDCTANNTIAKSIIDNELIEALVVSDTDSSTEEESSNIKTKSILSEAIKKEDNTISTSNAKDEDEFPELVVSDTDSMIDTKEIETIVKKESCVIVGEVEINVAGNENIEISNSIENEYPSSSIKEEITDDFKHFEENSVLRDQISKTPIQVKASSALPRRTLGVQDDTKITVDFKMKNEKVMLRKESLKVAENTKKEIHDITDCNDVKTQESSKIKSESIKTVNTEIVETVTELSKTLPSNEMVEENTKVYSTETSIQPYIQVDLEKSINETDVACTEENLSVDEISTQHNSKFEISENILNHETHPSSKMSTNIHPSVAKTTMTGQIKHLEDIVACQIASSDVQINKTTTEHCNEIESISSKTVQETNSNDTTKTIPKASTEEKSKMPVNKYFVDRNDELRTAPIQDEGAANMEETIPDEIAATILEEHPNNDEKSISQNIMPAETARNAIVGNDEFSNVHKEELMQASISKATEAKQAEQPKTQNENIGEQKIELPIDTKVHIKDTSTAKTAEERTKTLEIFKASVDEITLTNIKTEELSLKSVKASEQCTSTNIAPIKLRTRKGSQSSQCSTNEISTPKRRGHKNIEAVLQEDQKGEHIENSRESEKSAEDSKQSIKESNVSQISQKRGRRKATISESSQSSLASNDEPFKRKEKIRKQNTNAENILEEESGIDDTRVITEHHEDEKMDSETITEAPRDQTASSDDVFAGQNVEVGTGEIQVAESLAEESSIMAKNDGHFDKNKFVKSIIEIHVDDSEIAETSKAFNADENQKSVGEKISEAPTTSEQPHILVIMTPEHIQETSDDDQLPEITSKNDEQIHEVKSNIQMQVHAITETSVAVVDQQDENSANISDIITEEPPTTVESKLSEKGQPTSDALQQPNVSESSQCLSVDGAVHSNSPGQLAQETFDNEQGAERKAEKTITTRKNEKHIDEDNLVKSTVEMQVDNDKIAEITKTVTDRQDQKSLNMSDIVAQHSDTTQQPNVYESGQNSLVDGSEDSKHSIKQDQKVFTEQHAQETADDALVSEKHGGKTITTLKYDEHIDENQPVESTSKMQVDGNKITETLVAVADQEDKSSAVISDIITEELPTTEETEPSEKIQTDSDATQKPNVSESSQSSFVDSIKQKDQKEFTEQHSQETTDNGLVGETRAEKTITNPKNDEDQSVESTIKMQVDGNEIIKTSVAVAYQQDEKSTITDEPSTTVHAIVLEKIQPDSNTSQQSNVSESSQSLFVDHSKASIEQTNLEVSTGKHAVVSPGQHVQEISDDELIDETLAEKSIITPKNDEQNEENRPVESTIKMQVASDEITETSVAVADQRDKSANIVYIITDGPSTTVLAKHSEKVQPDCDASKQEPSKKNRRKPNISELSQSALVGGEHRVQNLPAENISKEKTEAVAELEIETLVIKPTTTEKTELEEKHTKEQSSTTVVEESIIDHKKQVSQKRGRRKQTVSESSQSSLHGDEEPSKHVVKHSNQNTLAENIIHEETEFTEDKPEVLQSAKTIEKEPAQHIEPVTEKPTTTALEEPITEQTEQVTQKRDRRKATVSESSQGSLLGKEEPSKRGVKHRNQNTLAESIIHEEIDADSKQHSEKNITEVKPEVLENDKTIKKEPAITQHTEAIAEQSTITALEEPITDQTKQVPQKGGRGKATVSESNQSSVLNQEELSKRVVKHRNQNTLAKSIIHEETEAGSKQQSEKKITEVKPEVLENAKTIEKEPVITQHTEPKAEQSTTALEDPITDQTKQVSQKRGRRKATVSESNQSSLLDKPSKHLVSHGNQNIPTVNLVEEPTSIDDNTETCSDDINKTVSVDTDQHTEEKEKVIGEAISEKRKARMMDKTDTLEDVFSEQHTKDTSAEVASDDGRVIEPLAEEPRTSSKNNESRIKNISATYVVKIHGECDEKAQSSKAISEIIMKRPSTTLQTKPVEVDSNFEVSHVPQKKRRKPNDSSQIDDEEPSKSKNRRRNQDTHAENIVDEETDVTEHPAEGNFTKIVTEDLQSVSKKHEPHAEEQSTDVEEPITYRTKKVSQMRSRRKQTVSESSQSSVLGEEESSNRRKQDTPVVNIEHEEATDVTEESVTVKYSEAEVAKIEIPAIPKSELEGSFTAQLDQECKTAANEEQPEAVRKETKTAPKRRAARKKDEHTEEIVNTTPDDNTEPTKDESAVTNLKLEETDSVTKPTTTRRGGRKAVEAPKETPTIVKRRVGERGKKAQTEQHDSIVIIDEVKSEQQSEELASTSAASNESKDLITKLQTKSTEDKEHLASTNKTATKIKAAAPKRVGGRKKVEQIDTVVEADTTVEHKDEESKSTLPGSNESGNLIPKIECETTEDEAHHASTKKTTTKAKTAAPKRVDGRKKVQQVDTVIETEITLEHKDEEPEKTEDIVPKKAVVTEVAATPRRTRKASALDVDRQQQQRSIEEVTASATADTTTPTPPTESPKRTTLRRAVATHTHNYDESSDTETASISARKLAATTTSRGRTRKPTARVQQYLEEELAKAETPSKRRLLSTVAAAESPIAIETPTATPKRVPARRGRKPSTIETCAVVLESPPHVTKKAAPQRGLRGRAASVVIDSLAEQPHTHSSAETAEDAHSSHVEDLDLPASAPAKGRKRVARKQQATTATDDGEEPLQKKSSELLAAEKETAATINETATPQRVGRRNLKATAVSTSVESVTPIAEESTKRGRGTRRVAAKTTNYVEESTVVEVHTYPEVEAEKPKSSTTRGGRAKAKVPPSTSQKRSEQRINSASSADAPVVGIVLDDEEDAPLAQVSTTKRIAPKGSIDSPATKRTRRKIIEDAETAQPSTADLPAPAAARTVRRGRNVRFEATPDVANTSTAAPIASADETTKEVVVVVAEVAAPADAKADAAPPPAKRATRTRRK